MFFCVWQHFFPILELSDWEQETYNVCFVQQNDSCQIGLYLQVKENLVSFCVHQHQFAKIFIFFSGGRDSHCFLCAAASVSKILSFFPGERDLHCFLCASVLLTKTCIFLLGEIDSQYHFTAAEFVFKFCLKKHSACVLI